MNTKKAGRPKGAVSLTQITVAKLLEIINHDPDAIITVGKIWLDKQSKPATLLTQDGDSLPSVILSQLQKEEQEQQEEEKVQFTIS